MIDQPHFIFCPTASLVQMNACGGVPPGPGPTPGAQESCGLVWQKSAIQSLSSRLRLSR